MSTNLITLITSQLNELFQVKQSIKTPKETKSCELLIENLVNQFFVVTDNEETNISLLITEEQSTTVRFFVNDDLSYGYFIPTEVLQLLLVDNFLLNKKLKITNSMANLLITFGITPYKKHFIK